MAARRSFDAMVGAAVSAVLIVCAVAGLPEEALAAPSEQGPSTSVAECSDPDSFGGAQDVGDNRLTVERPSIIPPAYRLVARWSRWDGQDLATLATSELGRPVDWASPRLVLRLREESQQGVTLLTQEQIVDTATFARADLPGGEQAMVDVDPALLRPRSGGSVSVKIRVERPGLDLATCWAEIPNAPSHGGSARSDSAMDLASTR